LLAGASGLVGRSRWARLADEDNFEGAGAVDTFDPVEFDVAGRRRAADPGQRAAGSQPGHGLRDQRDHLVRLDQAQVIVGDEAERTAALARPGVEDDGAGLGDGDRGAGDDAVGLVEFLGGQPAVGDQLDLVEVPAWPGSGWSSPGRSRPGGRTTRRAPRSASAARTVSSSCSGPVRRTWLR